MKLFKAKSGNYRTTESPFGPNETNEGKEKGKGKGKGKKEKGRSEVLFFRCKSSLLPQKQRVQSHNWEQIMTTPQTLLFLWFFSLSREKPLREARTYFPEVKMSCISAGSSELLLLQKGLRWSWFDETETSQAGWRECSRILFGAWEVGSSQYRPWSPSPAVGPGEAETSWVEILWVCDPKHWSLRYLGNCQWRTLHLPAPWLWLEKPLLSHPTFYLFHHPKAQPRINSCLEFWNSSTCASDSLGFHTGVHEDAPALPSLPLYIQCK